MRKLLVLLAALGLADAVYAADSFTGTWKLDTAKSKIESFPAPKEETLTERKQAGITDHETPVTSRESRASECYNSLSGNIRARSASVS
jgi:hypothetical protein